MKSFLVSLLATLAIAVSPIQSHAFTIFDVNTTINGFFEGGFAVVDGDMPPTVVEIVEGANIINKGEILNTSIINMRGGSIFSPFEGEFPTPAFQLVDQGTLNVFGGTIRANSSDAISAFGNSTVNIYGGTISSPDGDSIDASGQSTVNIHGGEFLAPIDIRENSTANIFGGDFNYAGSGHRVNNSATVNIYGGTFTGTDFGRIFSAGEQGILNIFGGQFGFENDNLYISAGGFGATINIFGTDLVFIEDQVFGTLADGSQIDLGILLVNGGEVVLHTVPEPPALILAGFAFLCSWPVFRCFQQGRKKYCE